MPIPPGAPPPQGHPQDGGGEGQGNQPPRRRGGQGGPQGPIRPVSHFTSNPIIKAEELERMDELGQQDGGWAAVQEEVDYNKKISFSDDEGGHGVDKDKRRRGGAGEAAEGPTRGGDRFMRGGDDSRPQERMTPRDSRDHREDDAPMRGRERGGPPIKILERPQQMMDRDSQRGGDRYDRENDRGEPQSASERGDRGRDRYQNDYNDGSSNANDQDDWKRKPAQQGFDERGRGPPGGGRGGGRMNMRGPPRGGDEEESWRSGSNNSKAQTQNFDDDPRNKKSVSSRGGDRDRDGMDRGGDRDRNRERDLRIGGEQRQNTGPSGGGGPASGSGGQGQDSGRRERGGPPGGVGGIGGGAGDFGPASGPFQSNLPPRLQRHHGPSIFSSQGGGGGGRDGGSQRKTPSPVPSGGNNGNLKVIYFKIDRTFLNDVTSSLGF